MREDTVVEQATAREIIHEDVEMLRRFGAAFLTVVFELSLSDVTVVDGEKAVLDCHDHSFVPRTLCNWPSAPRGPLEVSDVTRSSVTLSWLAPTLDGGATIVAHVIEQSRVPVTDGTRIARVRGSSSGRPSTDYHFRVCVGSDEICQTDAHQIVFTADG